jgi:DNA adenine methylase
MIDPAMQLILFDDAKAPRTVPPFTAQLLKWIGNKQRFAHEIVSYFPQTFNHYFEPFIGSGAVLATLCPERGTGSDNFQPLVQIWQTLRHDPELLKDWYRERWLRMKRARDKVKGYEEIKASYNKHPNGADLLFLCRTCYGGVVRFRQTDGYMSTPCGIHEPISPESFDRRADDWHQRTKGASSLCASYENVMKKAERGDLIYCDPPYSHSQTILYGAQGFDLEHLVDIATACKNRGVYVAISIDGMKKSGSKICNLPIPPGLFEREIFVHCGRSMLRRFQMDGQSLERKSSRIASCFHIEDSTQPP